MQRKQAEQSEARSMRAGGASLREIADALGVCHSSVSIWVREVPRGLPPDSEAELPCAAPEALPEGPLRRCGRCHHTLPESAFNRYRDGRQAWCRECFREYFRHRGDLHRRQSAETRRRRSEAGLRFVSEYKRTRACTDCGEGNADVLEFDHLIDKVGDVSAMAAAGVPIAVLRREIAKCEVVCANCHRRRTGRRAGWRRAHKPWWEAPRPKLRYSPRNVAVAYNELELSGCVDCGEDDLCVLDFDHVGPKNGSVMRMATGGVSLQNLRAEIANCEVRCANCHRLRTLTQVAERPAGRG